MESYKKIDDNTLEVTYSYQRKKKELEEEKQMAERDKEEARTF